MLNPELTDIYNKSQLTDKEKEVLSVSLATLEKGDTLWSDTPAMWGWALGFIQTLLDAASADHPQVVCYVEFLKDRGQYGLSLIRTSESSPEAPA